MSEDELARSRAHLVGKSVLQKKSIIVSGFQKDKFQHEDDVIQYFSRFGKICKVVINPRNGHHESIEDVGIDGNIYIYITFACEKGASNAVRELHGITLDEQVINAEFAFVKFCDEFLKGKHCGKLDCIMLHESVQSNRSTSPKSIRYVTPTKRHKDTPSRMHYNLTPNSNSSTKRYKDTYSIKYHERKERRSRGSNYENGYYNHMENPSPKYQTSPLRPSCMNTSFGYYNSPNTYNIISPSIHDGKKEICNSNYEINYYSNNPISPSPQYRTIHPISSYIYNGFEDKVPNSGRDFPQSHEKKKTRSIIDRDYSYCSDYTESPKRYDTKASPESIFLKNGLNKNSLKSCIISPPTRNIKFEHKREGIDNPWALASPVMIVEDNFQKYDDMTKQQITTKKPLYENNTNNQYGFGCGRPQIERESPRSTESPLTNPLYYQSAHDRSNIPNFQESNQFHYTPHDYFIPTNNVSERYFGPNKAKYFMSPGNHTFSISPYQQARYTQNYFYPFAANLDNFKSARYYMNPIAYTTNMTCLQEVESTPIRNWNRYTYPYYSKE